jgi:hypothetical protein
VGLDDVGHKADFRTGKVDTFRDWVAVQGSNKARALWIKFLHAEQPFAAMPLGVLTQLVTDLWLLSALALSWSCMPPAFMSAVLA